MYKYFSEMDKLANFKTYLVNWTGDINSDIHVNNIPLEEELFNKYNDLTERIKFASMLLKGFNSDLEIKSFNYKTLSCKEWYEFHELISGIDCLEDKYIMENLDVNTDDLEKILYKYGIYCSCLSKLFPDFKDYLKESEHILLKCREELNKKSTIKIQSETYEMVEFIWPNAWYITPDGFLYNTNGKDGHKGGNLLYSIYRIIDALENNENIPDFNYSDKIKEILNRGYITYEEFTEYSNSKYALPTIKTPIIESEIKRYKEILKLNEEDLKKLTSSPNFKWPNPRRSYQKNLITLITGYYAAEGALNKSFTKLNDSNKKSELFKKINDLSYGYLEDILVRYSDFSKIESCEKKITTSSLYGIKEFKNYLDKGWDLYIIPKIIYDKENDIVEVNFDSYFIDKYIDKELNEYNGKGKVLIRGKNC
jgi:hypothetical protein